MFQAVLEIFPRVEAVDDRASHKREDVSGDFGAAIGAAGLEHLPQNHKRLHASLCSVVTDLDISRFEIRLHAFEIVPQIVHRRIEARSFRRLRLLHQLLYLLQYGRMFLLPSFQNLVGRQSLFPVFSFHLKQAVHIGHHFLADGVSSLFPVHSLQDVREPAPGMAEAVLPPDVGIRCCQRLVAGIIVADKVSLVSRQHFFCLGDRPFAIEAVDCHLIRTVEGRKIDEHVAFLSVPVLFRLP